MRNFLSNVYSSWLIFWYGTCMIVAHVAESLLNRLGRLIEIRNPFRGKGR